MSALEADDVDDALSQARVALDLANLEGDADWRDLDSVSIHPYPIDSEVNRVV